MSAGDAEALHLEIEPPARQAEDASPSPRCCRRRVRAPFDHLALQLFDRRGERGAPAARLATTRRRRSSRPSAGDNMSGVIEPAARRQRDRPLHFVPQLPHVARPGEGVEQIQRFLAQTHTLVSPAGRTTHAGRTCSGARSLPAVRAAAGCGCGSRSADRTDLRGTCPPRPAARGRHWSRRRRGRRPSADGSRRPAAPRPVRESAAAWAGRRAAGRRPRPGTACRRRRCGARRAGRQPRR